MTLFLFIILLILLTYLGVLNLKDGKKPFQNSQKTKTEKTKIRQFFTTQESLDLAQETCQEFGIYFINEISTKTKIDDQIWNFKSILKNTNFEKLLEIYSLKEEKLKFQVETIFKSYQNDWMSQKILETEIYTTKNYQNELWQIYRFHIDLKSDF